MQTAVSHSLSSFICRMLVRPNKNKIPLFPVSRPTLIYTPDPNSPVNLHQNTTIPRTNCNRNYFCGKLFFIPILFTGSFSLKIGSAEIGYFEGKKFNFCVKSRKIGKSHSLNIFSF